jgi:3-oxoacyl-[acyl-carrier protein] reductase
MKHKVALVTGGSRGIGKAIAVGLASCNTHVCLVARDEKILIDSVSELQDISSMEHMYVVGDVSREGVEREIHSQILEKFSGVHILINNSGGPPPGSFTDVSNSEWNRAIENNFMSVVRFTKEFYPFMKSQQWGRIINITSTVAKEPSGSLVLSASTRAAVSAYSKAISDELAPHGVTINSICPGSVLTDRLDSLVKEMAVRKNIEREEQLQKSQAVIPMKRFASPIEIAELAVFLASEKSSYMTGQSIVIDGGLTRGYF